MATTNFQTGTLIESTWLNDVDNAVYVDVPANTAAIAAHIADTADAHDASAISNVAAGNIVATTVQAAIDELDAEKQPIDTLLTAISGGTLGSFGFRNRIYNGDFSVVQRATSMALTTSRTYGSVDRFAFIQETSANGIAAQTTVTSQPFRFALKLGRNAAAVTTGVISGWQALPTTDSITLRGKQVTLSFYAKAGTNYSATSSLMSCAIYSGEGTNESVTTMGSWTNSATVVSAQKTLTTSWQQFSITGTVSATATQLGIYLAYTPVGTAGADDNMYISMVQLEEGSEATPYEFKTPTLERSLCQLFWEPSNSNDSIFSGNVTSAGNYYSNVGFKVTKRIAPTVVLTNISNTNFTSSVGTTVIDVGGFRENRVANGTGGGVFQSSWTADAEL